LCELRESVGSWVRVEEFCAGVVYVIVQMVWDIDRDAF
jgi:hypothetical protein